MNRLLSGLALLALITACGDKNDTAAPVAVESPQETIRSLQWHELMPEGEEEVLAKLYEDFYAELEDRLFSSQPRMLSDASPIMEGSPLDEMPQIGTFNTVEELNGQRIEIPGFVVPLDVAAQKLSAFLIVPYFGACIHTPPPAPNQIIYAIAEPAQQLENLYYPMWFTGVLETGRQDTDVGNAAYTLQIEAVRPYE